MTTLIGSIGNSKGQFLPGKWKIQLTGTLIDESTSPDSINTNYPYEFKTNGGNFSFVLPQSETEGVPYKFEYYLRKTYTSNTDEDYDNTPHLIFNAIVPDSLVDIELAQLITSSVIANDDLVIGRKITECDIIFINSTTISTIVSTSTATKSELIINRFNNKTYKYFGGEWQEIQPSTTLSVINKNTGNIFKWNGTKWLVSSREINIKDWGARGDGYDDSIPVQAAINQALTEGMGEIYFPVGDYWLNVIIPNNGSTIAYNTISLIGSGTNATFIRSHSSNGFAITYSALDNWQFPRVENLTFLGNDGLTKSGVTFNTQFSGGVAFRNVNFRSLNYGVKKPYGNIGCKFENCSWYGCNFHYHAESVSDMHAGNDVFTACHLQGAAIASIYINSPLAGTGQTVFENCVWELNPGFCFFIESYNSVWTPGFVLDKCWFEQNATAVSVTFDSISYTPKTCRFKDIYVSAKNLMLRDWDLVGATLYLDECGTSEDLADVITKDVNSFIYATTIRSNPSNTSGIARSISLIDKVITRFDGIKDLVTQPRKNLLFSSPGALFTESFARKGSYLFTGSPSNKSAFTVNDGVLFPQCGELEVAQGDDLYYKGDLPDFPTIPTNKFIVWSIDVKQPTGNPIIVEINFVSADLSNPENRWRTIAGMFNTFDTPAFGTALRIRKTTTGTGTIRLSAFQIMFFDTFDEAASFLNSEVFCTFEQRGRILYSDSVFTTGSWSKGDIIYNTNPIAGGNAGWICVTSGAPGTWKSFGTIDS